MFEGNTGPCLVGSWTFYKVNSICLVFLLSFAATVLSFRPLFFRTIRASHDSHSFELSLVPLIELTLSFSGHLSRRSRYCLNTSNILHSFQPEKNAIPQHSLDAERCSVWCTGSRCPTSWPISYSLLSRQPTTCSGALLRVRK